jgi:hypothetical protein
MHFRVFTIEESDDEEGEPVAPRYASVVLEEEFIEDEPEGWSGAETSGSLVDPQEELKPVQGWDPREDAPYFFHIQ